MKRSGRDPHGRARRAGWVTGPVIRAFLALACVSADSIVAVAQATPLPDDLNGRTVPLALMHANVVPMNVEGILPDRTVLLRDGRIIAILAPDSGEVPSGVRRIDVGGRYLVPGLADMHVHMSDEDATAFLAHGVTLVRDMWGGPNTLRLRSEASSGAPIPTVIAASPGIDGDPPVRAGASILRDGRGAAALVDGLADAGYDCLKVYQSLSREAFEALAEAAAGRSMDLVGHVPTAVPLEDALSRMRSIEHLEGYDKALAGRRERAFMAWVRADTAAMRGLAERTRSEGVWNTPTLVVASRVVSRALDPGAARVAVEKMRLMVLRLHQAGAPLLAGTDAGVPLVEPGVSIHEELVELVAAGLDTQDALATATVNAARFLRMAGEFGVVARGARADLLLVESNPLEDLSVLRSPRVVILRGRWLDRGGATPGSR